MLIQDGRTGNTAHVNGNNRLETACITDPIQDHACEVGRKYNINTGDITLTNATKTTTLYIKNNETADLIITALIYNLGATTSGTGDVKIEVLRNPTAGGIISNANNVEAGAGLEANQNFGSNLALTINAYKGATGETAASGGQGVSVSTRSASNTGRIVVSLGSVILTQGSSLAVDYTPPTSNTSQICQFAAACYLKTSDVEAD